jgi:molecular chaperone GrpE (heat shock protein)
MSATTEPKADAAQGRGDTFDAEYAALVAGQDAPAQTDAPAQPGQPQTPEAEDEGRTTPPRDERGRVASSQQEAQAPPAQEPSQPAQPAAQEQPAPDKAAQLEARLAELERNYSGNLRQKDAEILALRQRETQARQQWQQDQAQQLATYRQRLRDDLETRLGQSPDLTDREKYLYRQDLKAQFLEEDNARLQAERDAERQGWTAQLGTTQQQYQRALLPQVLPQVLATYAAQLAAKATQHGAQATPEEAAAFLAEPAVRQQIEWAWTQPLAPDAKERLVDSIEAQQAWSLAERSRLATERRDFAAQQQLAANRANAAGSGATRELVPGSAGPTDPDLARYQSRPGNEGDHFDALWAATRQEQ